MRRILAMVLMNITGLLLTLMVYEFLFSYEFVAIIGSNRERQSCRKGIKTSRDVL